MQNGSRPMSLMRQSIKRKLNSMGYGKVVDAALIQDLPKARGTKEAKLVARAPRGGKKTRYATAPRQVVPFEKAEQAEETIYDTSIDMEDNGPSLDGGKSNASSNLSHLLQVFVSVLRWLSSYLPHPTPLDCPKSLRELGP